VKASSLEQRRKDARLAQLRRGMISAAALLGNWGDAADEYIELINAYPEDAALGQEAALVPARTRSATSCSGSIARRWRLRRATLAGALCWRGWRRRSKIIRRRSRPMARRFTCGRSRRILYQSRAELEERLAQAGRCRCRLRAALQAELPRSAMDGEGGRKRKRGRDGMPMR
jgi:hypothetical protein